MGFGNPCVGYLHPLNWARPADNTDMKVTQDAAGHMSSYTGHPAGPPALDIGDGDPDHDAVLSCSDGVVSKASTVGSANLEIDYTDSAGQKWRFVYAHNVLPHPVVYGQRIAMGQVIGKQGMTGANAIHLHLQIGKWNGTSYVWLDPWLYLEQNLNMKPIATAAFKHLQNKKASLKVDTRFRSDRFTDSPVLRVFPAGTELFPVCSATDGTSVDGNPLWFGAFLYDDSPAGFAFGWFHSSGVGALSDVVVADCTQQIAAAVAPINAALAGANDRVKKIKAKVALAAADIADD